MKKFASLVLGLGILFGSAVLAVAQSTEAAPAADKAQAETLRITEKEVIAVQVALYQRNYVQTRPNGILDRQTREALKAFQQDNDLPATGKVDRATYDRLELTYPATGKEIERLRKNGLLPRIGYGVKDATVATGKTISNAPGKVKEATRTGVEKAGELGSGAASKSKEVAVGLGDATKSGAQSLGRASGRAAESLVSRSDADIQKELSALLAQEQQTSGWQSTVKQGRVTLKTTPQHTADLGAVVADIRKIVGVKSVMVIAQ